MHNQVVYDKKEFKKIFIILPSGAIHKLRWHIFDIDNLQRVIDGSNTLVNYLQKNTPTLTNIDIW